MQTPSIKIIRSELKPLILYDNPDILTKYGTDSSRCTANPLGVIFPNKIEDVLKIVNCAIKNRIPIIPSGGRTGLTGAATANNKELIISFDKMNKIHALNAISKTVICEPGVILQQLHEYVEQHELFYPVSLAAKGSCQIGGNIATNAGGINVIRYGGTRNWVAGLKVITGTGELLQLNHIGLVKDNTGYALSELFIGSEGTIGIIVEATLKLTRLPFNPKIMIFSHLNLDDVLHTLQALQTQIDLIAFETFDQLALQKVTTKHNISKPFATNTPFYSLIEFENSPIIEEKIMNIFSKCLEQGIITDGIISVNDQQRSQLWRYREDINDSLSNDYPQKYDITVPIDYIAKFHKSANQLLKQIPCQPQAVWFGHIGDGNLHLNILKPPTITEKKFIEQCEKFSHVFFSLLQSMQGSISAEHGIGLLKKPYLQYTRSIEEIKLMQQIKQILDPMGIMNPGKIFA